MFKNLAKAFGQLGDPKLNWVILASAGLALLVLIILVVVVNILLQDTTLFETWYLTWVNFAVRWLGTFGAIIIAWFIFPAIVSIVVGAFLEYVSRAVEKRHYPELAAPRDQPFVTEILPELLKFLFIIILVNLIALPFYILTWWILGLGFVISWLVNGYLVGREYMEMVAMRRMPPKEAKAFRRDHGGTVFAAGFLVVMLMSVPFLNLIMPVVATAFMTHVFEDLRRKAPAKERTAA